MNARPTEVQRALAGADYPASPDDLIAVAEQHDASGDVLEDLGNLSEEEYGSAAEVMAELGEDEEEDED